MEKKKTQIEPERDSESRSAFAQDTLEFAESTTQQMANLFPKAFLVCSSREFRSLVETQAVILRALASLLDMADTIHQKDPEKVDPR